MKQDGSGAVVGAKSATAMALDCGKDCAEESADGRARRIACIATALVTLAVIGGAFAVRAAASTADPYWGPGYGACGRETFHTRDQAAVRLYIAKKNIPCSLAVRIEREYWSAPNRRLMIVNGGSGAHGYVLLKRYPGWKCTSGAGAGSCQNGGRFAGYSYRRS